MLWALIIQAVILAVGMPAARRARSARAALTLVASPVAIVASAVALGGLPLMPAIATSAALLALVALLAGWQSRDHYAIADAQHQTSARERHEAVAGALLASAVYAGALALLTVTLGVLLRE